MVSGLAGIVGDGGAGVKRCKVVQYLGMVLGSWVLVLFAVAMWSLGTLSGPPLLIIITR